MIYFLFFTGLVLLIVGAELLVRGASRLALGLGLSPLVIGLTVVAFGTSTPELAVSIESALSGNASIAAGNVVGSNIFNVLFILGVTAIIAPLSVAQNLIRFDVPFMIVLSVVLLVLSLDMNLSRFDGVMLFIGLVIYVWFLVYQSRKKHDSIAKEAKNHPASTNISGVGLLVNIGLVVSGLVILVIGSRWLVDSAVAFAQTMAVSELIIGLTIVAAGTSLPEVVTSVIAVIRGERDIAVGNVVGSNIFNIMGVLGLSSIVAPTGIELSSSIIGFDIPVMIAVAVLCLPLFFTGSSISRQEGVVLIGYYAAYTAYLILAASHHDSLPMFSAIMLFIVMPLTILVFFVLSFREMRR